MQTQSSPLIPRWILIILATVLSVLLLAGVWFYQSQRDSLRQVIIRDLSAIAQLKVDQLASWRSERLGNAELIMNSGPLLAAAANVIADPQSESRQLIRSRFLSFQANHNYDDVVLVNLSGEILLSLAERTQALSDCCLKLFNAGMQSRNALLTNVYPDPTTLVPHLTVVAPLFLDDQSKTEPLGAILLISNIEEQLFPMIQGWPVPSDTGEAYLVRRDGDEVLFLSALRHQPGAAFSLRVPLDRNDSPAVAAVLGHRGLFEGRDYRGVEVVAVVHPVPDSPWYLVVKKDADEIFAEWHFRAAMISGLLAALIFCVGTLGVLLWQRDRKIYYEKLYASEAAQRTAEQRHSIVLRAIGDAVIATDASGRVELLNAVAEKLTGWSENEALKHPLEEVFQIISEENREVVESPVTKVLKEGLVVGLANHTLLIARDGTEHPIADSGAPIFDDRGNITGVVLVFRDQTEERRVQLELRDSEYRFRSFVENAHDVVYSLSPEGIFTYVSPNWNALTDVTGQNPIGSSFELYLHSEDLPVFRKFFNKTLSSGKKTTSLEYRVKCSDGSWRWYISSGSPLQDKEGRITGFLGIARDVTERIALQDQLLQSQRVEAVGQLAGGVAHDFNNMLAVILGNAELALARTTPENPLYNRLNQIVVAAQRSADVTRQLLAFARKQTIAPKILDLNLCVEGMLQMLQRLLGEDIDIAWRPSPELWPIRIDPSQLDQLLANLCVNARDAIGGVGKLTIETGTVSIDENYCAGHVGFIPGEFVMLAVSDDGCGMDRQTQTRIFEPFFTTKRAGKGTGLGLSTVYGIVKQNQGFINVYSEPDRGTTFRIYLPRQTGEIESVPAPVEIITPPGRGETLLVVEDDQSILEMIRTMLEDRNYKILQAMTPSEAIRLSEKGETSIDLLITDVVMPEMNGRDLAGILKALQPQMKVLFMSGYTSNVIAHHGVLDQGVHFIQKPFSVADFASEVRKVLMEDRQ